MDKIICDVCGTTYPESAAQCPICGYAKPTKAKAAPDNGDGQSGSYVYVKGGRFSSSNVHKRNIENGVTPSPEDSLPEKEYRKPNYGAFFGTAAVVILFALIAVLIFFIVKIASRQADTSNTGHGGASSTQQTDDPNVAVPCRELHTNSVDVSLTESGAKWLIQVTPLPANTTDEVSFVSQDPSIATVDNSGTITAVSPGKTAVVVTCGEKSLIITVTCTFDDGKTWSLNREDISLFKAGETWDLYSKTSTVAKNKITWTCADPSIATVDGGIVTAVSAGITTVQAEYNGTVLTCTVRCKISEDEGNGKDNDKENNVDSATLKISHTDVTIRVNETFNLTLRDAGGNVANVVWKVSRNGYVSVAGNQVKGAKSTGKDYVTVSTEYEGKTYRCIVRVK